MCTWLSSPNLYPRRTVSQVGPLWPTKKLWVLITWLLYFTYRQRAVSNIKNSISYKKWYHMNMLHAQYIIWEELICRLVQYKCIYGPETRSSMLYHGLRFGLVGGRRVDTKWRVRCSCHDIHVAKCHSLIQNCHENHVRIDKSEGMARPTCLQLDNVKRKRKIWGLDLEAFRFPVFQINRKIDKKKKHSYRESDGCRNKRDGGDVCGARARCNRCDYGAGLEY